MYHCIDCPDISFERRSLCERHVFEKHSDFGYQCTICLKVFNRPDNHSGKCVGNELLLRKKSTKTFTEKEAEEYRKFMKSVSQRVSVKKEDQRRTPSERHQVQQRNRKRSHQRSLSLNQGDKENQGTSKRNRSEDTRRVLGRETQEKVERSHTEVLRDNSKNNQETEKEPRKEETPVIDTNTTQLDDCLSLYAGEFSDADIQEAIDEIVETLPQIDGEIKFASPKKVQPPASPVSFTKRPLTTPDPDSPTVTTSSSLVQQSATYSPILKENAALQAPPYIATPKEDNKMKKVKESQRKRLILNVGGRRFETSVSTLMSKPQALLARMISPSGIKPYSVDNVYTYFLDRNPNNFQIILDYLRNDGEMPLEALPIEIRALRELTLEAKFYELKHLELLAEKKIMELRSEELNCQLATLKKI